MKSDEYVLNEHDLIVTKTNLNGVITFANNDLSRITGYSREEIIGQQHRIFRHPDMPEAVYIDLWKTILNQATWRGIIKNKTKDGGFYWVSADVTPFYENDTLVGHMSVRRKASIEDIQRAQKAYAQMKAGTFTGQLSYGEIQDEYVFTTAKRKLNNLSVATKLGMLLSLNILVIVLLEVVNFSNLNTLNDNHLKTLTQMQAYTSEVNEAHAKQILGDNPPATIKKLKEEVKLNDYFYQANTNSNQKVLNIQHETIFIVFTVLVLLIVLCNIIIRSIVVPLKEATRTLINISSGNYHVPVEHRSKSEVGRLIEALRATSVRLGFDIANEKKVADELIRLKVGLDNLSTGVAIADNDREIIYINPAAFNMFKQVEPDLKQFIPAFDMDKIIGKKIESFHRNPAFHQQLLDNMDRPTRFEMRVGEQLIVVNALPVNNALKHRVGLVAEFENITEREHNKAKLLSTIEQNQALNHQVNQMQKVESLSRLTSGIAHDFNNILSAIIGYNQLNAFAADDCQDEALKEEIAYNTNQVSIASERAANLIKKMMAYSRQSASYHDMDVKLTADVIEEVLSLMRPALTSLFQLNADIDSELTIQIDSTSLHQIITNLVVNARDAMPKGGSVMVSLQKVTTAELLCDDCVHPFEGELIELRVSDTGTGIDQKVIDHIFDPFFTTKEVGEGTGLGLSTVSGMVHEARGHIKVESKTTEPNQGTVFRLLFPLNELKK